ncbi:hypothetical protein PPL_09676 [Heterostelium album PN500]|uniref:Uncharacterized protein n=1 Tax=Heterostelium pallidum (strain ATCC 26659 / Pp 5 / PN500) TaxID=670386 RepID=D3BNH3_HETP5|nr:hypothetical protein PPL_09676 [Heterostelium album PN500]EFA76924.1 hypothetical protein PPL_09676 [Heterostelium album PN500]|eukprot:XP_020429056.1 hypothetical protein PPL_09676 [Heterostelium album PN500]
MEEYEYYDDVLRLLSFFRKSSNAITLAKNIKSDAASENQSTKFKTACVTRWGKRQDSILEFKKRVSTGEQLMLLDDIILVLEKFNHVITLLSAEKQPTLASGKQTEVALYFLILPIEFSTIIRTCFILLSNALSCSSERSAGSLPSQKGTREFGRE